jgi:putative transposase
MSLHDVQVRLAAFLDEHYHRAPHGGLYGKTPAEAWAGATCRAVDEPALAAALTIHRRRRVRKDGTVDVDGHVWQLDQGFLAGRVITVVAAHAGLAGEPVALHDGHRYPLRPADPIAASRTRRKRRGEAPPPSIPFDPAGALLDKAAGRRPRHRKDPS